MNFPKWSANLAIGTASGVMAGIILLAPRLLYEGKVEVFYSKKPFTEAAEISDVDLIRNDISCFEIQESSIGGNMFGHRRAIQHKYRIQNKSDELVHADLIVLNIEESMSRGIRSGWDFRTERETSDEDYSLHWVLSNLENRPAHDVHGYVKMRNHVCSQSPRVCCTVDLNSREVESTESLVTFNQSRLGGYQSTDIEIGNMVSDTDFTFENTLLETEDLSCAWSTFVRVQYDLKWNIHNVEYAESGDQFFWAHWGGCGDGSISNYEFESQDLKPGDTKMISDNVQIRPGEEYIFYVTVFTEKSFEISGQLLLFRNGKKVASSPTFVSRYSPSDPSAVHLVPGHNGIKLDTWGGSVATERFTPSGSKIREDNLIEIPLTNGDNLSLTERIDEPATTIVVLSN